MRNQLKIENIEKIKVLVVEDDDNQILIIEQSLRRMGLQVTGVMLGNEAIEIYKQQPDFLLLLDYNLPDINGFEVIDELRKCGYKVDFITMTAFGNEHVAVEMMKRGARDYIVKDTNFVDFLPSVILNTINRIQIEKKLAESQEELHQAQERYYDLFENSQDAVCFTSKEGNLLGFNQSMQKSFDYQKDELLNTNLKDLFFNYVERMYFVEELDRKGYVKNFEAQMVNSSGLILECLISATLRKDKTEKILGYNGIIHDITARKKAEMRVAESEARYRSLFERIPLGLYISTPNGDFLDVNPGLLNMLGLKDKKDILNLNGADLYFDIKDRDKWQQSMDKYGVVFSEMQLKTPVGKIIWVQDSARAVRDSSGIVKFYEGVLRDITESKLFEQEREKLISELKSSKEKVEQLANEVMDLNYELLVSADQLKSINSSKDKLFSIIAHDLKSPFTGFLGLSELISADIDDLSKEEIAVMADAMNSSAKHIYQLLVNLLEWSRLQGGLIEINPEPLNLKRNIDISLQLIKHQADMKKITLINEVDEQVIVYADKNLLSTLLRNLITNAVKFTNLDGYVKIYIDRIFGNRISFNVEDNGVGMDEIAANTIFKIDKHYSTTGTNNEKGTGLGLMLSKELLDKSDGNISVKSEIGKGTIFSVTLPINEED